MVLMAIKKQNHALQSRIDEVIDEASSQRKVQMLHLHKDLDKIIVQFQTEVETVTESFNKYKDDVNLQIQALDQQL
jgi:hypothetical protein